MNRWALADVFGQWHLCRSADVSNHLMKGEFPINEKVLPCELCTSPCGFCTRANFGVPDDRGSPPPTFNFDYESPIKPEPVPDSYFFNFPRDNPMPAKTNRSITGVLLYVENEFRYVRVRYSDETAESHLLASESLRELKVRHGLPPDCSMEKLLGSLEKVDVQ